MFLMTSVAVLEIRGVKNPRLRALNEKKVRPPDKRCVYDVLPFKNVLRTDARTERVTVNCENGRTIIFSSFIKVQSKKRSEITHNCVSCVKMRYEETDGRMNSEVTNANGVNKLVSSHFIQISSKTRSEIAHFPSF